MADPCSPVIGSTWRSSRSGSQSERLVGPLRGRYTRRDCSHPHVHPSSERPRRMLRGSVRWRPPYSRADLIGRMAAGMSPWRDSSLRPGRSDPPTGCREIARGL